MIRSFKYYSTVTLSVLCGASADSDTAETRSRVRVHVAWYVRTHACLMRSERSCAWALAPREHVVGGGAYHATHREDEQRDGEDSLDLEPTVCNKVAIAHSRRHIQVRGTAPHALRVCTEPSVAPEHAVGCTRERLDEVRRPDHIDTEIDVGVVLDLRDEVDHQNDLHSNSAGRASYLARWC